MLAPDPRRGTRLPSGPTCTPSGVVKHFFRDNSLTIVLLAIFLAAACGQALVGHRVDCDERQQHGLPARDLGEYLGSGPFLEALFENWESEFLEMAALILLSVFLHQRGAADSKPPEKGANDSGKEPRHPPADSPRAVKKGGLILELYSSSLTLALVCLFLFSFSMHALHGWRKYAEEEQMHGQKRPAFGEYVLGPQFWFESFQNWQSEFFGVATMGLLSIWLRQRGSPHSKPVAAPHRQTGA